LADIRKELEQVDESQEAEVIAKHPLYAELSAEYGAPVVRREKDNSHSSDLVKFKFFDHENTGEQYKFLFERQLFKNYSVYDLFFYAATGVNSDPLGIRLYWITKAQNAKMYRLENAADILTESKDSEQETAGWRSIEVALSRSTKLLDLVFYDDVNQIRIEIDPINEANDNMPKLPKELVDIGEFAEILDA
jgi:hypothetical protein